MICLAEKPQPRRHACERYVPQQRNERVHDSQSQTLRGCAACSGLCEWIRPRGDDKAATRELVLTLVDVAKGIINRSIPLTPTQLSAIRRRSNDIQALVKPNTTLATRNRILQKEGFLPTILGPLLKGVLPALLGGMLGGGC